MYLLVHFHPIWSVVPSIGSAISLLAVGAVRGFDEPFDNDTVFYLPCGAVGSALFAFWPGRMSSVRAEAKTARPLAPGTALPAAGTSLAHGADWSFLTLPTVTVTNHVGTRRTQTRPPVRGTGGACPGRHGEKRSGPKSASDSSLSPSRISAARSRPITGPSVMPLCETAS